MPAVPRTMAFETTCCTKRSGVSGPKIFAKSSIRICTKAETWKIEELCFCFLKSGNLFAVVLVHHVSLVWAPEDAWSHADWEIGRGHHVLLKYHCQCSCGWIWIYIPVDLGDSYSPKQLFLCNTCHQRVSQPLAASFLWPWGDRTATDIRGGTHSRAA